MRGRDVRLHHGGNLPTALTVDDLKLGWRRVLQDHADGRAFVIDPLLFGVLSTCADEWIALLHADLEAGKYAPASAQIVEVPKGKAAVRPGTLLTPVDQVVYYSLVGAALPHIIPFITFDPGPIDHAYQINAPKTVAWLKNRFKCWDGFRVASVAQLETGTTVMVNTDITGFYEHISLKILFSDLRACGVPEPLLELLGSCLSRWAHVDGRGIPQGMSPSDILAKLYLATSDRALREAGYRHLRYVDDHRIFCDGRPSAKRAILELARSLRRRGLTLQSAKTDLKPLDKARLLVDGIFPTLRPLAKGYLAEIAKAAGREPKYLTITEAEALIEKNGLTPPTAMLKEAYTVFVEGSPDFDKTMFHYLLNRLGKAKDGTAVPHALTLLVEHPEETEYILRYLGAVGQFRAREPELIAVLLSPEAIYPFQHYQTLLAAVHCGGAPSEEMLGLARRVVRAERTPPYLRTVATALLAKHGSAADLEFQLDAYAQAATPEEKAIVACSIYRLEVGRRNALLGQSVTDGYVVAKAAECVRAYRVAAFLGDTDAA